MPQQNDGYCKTRKRGCRLLFHYFESGETLYGELREIALKVHTIGQFAPIAERYATGSGFNGEAHKGTRNRMTKAHRIIRLLSFRCAYPN